MFEQTFRNLDDILRKEAGCASELDYTEQTSWLLFLKYLDDLETARATDAELRGQDYTPIIDAAHRWADGQRLRMPPASWITIALIPGRT